MSTPDTCPDLETLFVGLAEGDPEMVRHVETCAECAAIIEEHRQLEKDLGRIADPLPPPNFVHLVMAKVEKAPVPMRREVWSGIGIFAAALAGIVAVVLTDSTTAAAAGAGFASALLSLRELFLASGQALRAVWATAALPLVAFASVIFLFVLFGLRRLAAAPVASRVSA